MILTTLMMLLGFQTSEPRSIRLIRQTADSSFVVVRCVASNADTVRATWTYPNFNRSVALRPASCYDTARVARGTVAQTLSVTLTPKRGSTSGAGRSASISISPRLVPTPPPTVDSIRLDTTTTVTPPPVDTTPPPSSGGFVDPSHFPSDLTLWFDDDLDNMAQNEYPAPGSQLRWGFRGPTDWRVRDATTPYSDGALRVTFPGNGYGDGYGVGLILREEGCWPRMYTVAMEKFEGSGGQPYKVHFNEEKTVFPRTIVCEDNSEDNSGPDIAYVARNNRIEIQLQNGLGSPRRYQNFPVWYTTERWHKVEHYMQANTPGRQDGIWRMWIDGVLTADFSDILYSVNGRQVGFQGVRWESVRGGGRDNAPTPAGGQTRTYDRLATYVSDRIR